jgi:hypothetical protein
MFTVVNSGIPADLAPKIVHSCELDTAKVGAFANHQER